MIEIKATNGEVMRVKAEPTDTLEGIASRMNGTVYELIDHINDLIEYGWNGDEIRWEYM